MRSGLIIGTEVATNGLESGASLRVNSIKDLLITEGYEVQVSSRRTAKKALESEWDLIVLVSYSTARFLRPARKATRKLWFDPTDSWSKTRLSFLRRGDFRHAVLLLRDLLWVWTSPTIDLITFITQRDSQRENLWWRLRSKPLILPILGLDREVNPGSESRLIFIGDGNYGPNKEALIFLQETLKFLPNDVCIHIFGTAINSDNPRIIKHGYTPSSEMYSVDDIHLAPIVHGGGMKIKVAIPLWNGLRVISTAEAAVGFKNLENLHLANTPVKFAQIILEIQKPGSVQMPINQESRIYLDDQSSEVIGWLQERFL